MSVTSPPGPPRSGGTLERAELEALAEALIEEARQRARRRRRKYAAGALLAALVGAMAFAAFERTAANSQAVSPGRALSAPPSFSSLPGRSGLVTAFAFDSGAPDTVYAGTLGLGMEGAGRVYKTTDAGHTWLTASGPEWSRVDSLAADPQRPGTLYAGTGTAVFKTVDGGRNWRGWNRGLLPPPPVEPYQVTGTPGWRRAEGWVTALAVDPTDSDIVYANAGGIRKSTDGGHSWKTVFWNKSVGGIATLAIDPTSPHVMYAATMDVNTGDSAVYTSEDGGKTLRPTGLAHVPNRDGFGYAFAFDAQRPGTVYTAIGRTIFRTTDAGRSWLAIRRGLPGQVVTSLTADPRRPGTVYAGSSGGGIFKTTNGGRSWSRAVAGIVVTAVAVDASRPGTIYAAGVAKRRAQSGWTSGDTLILRSIDGGRAWTVRD